MKRITKIIDSGVSGLSARLLAVLLRSLPLLLRARARLSTSFRHRLAEKNFTVRIGVRADGLESALSFAGGRVARCLPPAGGAEVEIIFSDRATVLQLLR